MSISLKEWQHEVESYCMGDNVEPSSMLKESLITRNEFSAELGLAIYHNAYRARFLEVLRGDYAAVHAWLGDEEFDALALAYIQEYPASHFSLRWLGKNFPVFIRQYLIAEQSNPLSELALFEWAFTLAFDAADARLLVKDDLVALPADEWPNMRVALQPSVQWQELQYNTLDLWRFLKGMPESQEKGFPDSHKLESESTCIIWRQDLITRYRSLENDEAVALYGMTTKGWNFAELCAQLNTLGDNAAVQAVSWLHQWLSDGLLVLNSGGEPAVYRVDDVL